MSQPGEQVRQFRARWALTQADFAELMGGVSLATIHGWEHGRRGVPPMVSIIMDLVDGGFVTIAELDRIASRARRARKSWSR